jgi:hypothetical protein
MRIRIELTIPAEGSVRFFEFCAEAAQQGGFFIPPTHFNQQGIPMSGTTIRVVPYGDPSTAPRNSPLQALENLRAVKPSAAAFGGTEVLCVARTAGAGDCLFYPRFL